MTVRVQFPAPKEPETPSVPQNPSAPQNPSTPQTPSVPETSPLPSIPSTDPVPETSPLPLIPEAKPEQNEAADEGAVSTGGTDPLETETAGEDDAPQPDATPAPDTAADSSSEAAPESAPVQEHQRPAGLSAAMVALAAIVLVAAGAADLPAAPQKINRTPQERVRLGPLFFACVPLARWCIMAAGGGRYGTTAAAGRRPDHPGEPAGGAAGRGGAAGAAGIFAPGR